jgi:hypothetical protein
MQTHARHVPGPCASLHGNASASATLIAVVLWKPRAAWNATHISPVCTVGRSAEQA